MRLLRSFILLYHLAGALCESIAQGGMIASQLRLASLYGGDPPSLIFGSGATEIRFVANNNSELMIGSPTSSLMVFTTNNSIKIQAQQLLLQHGLNIQGSFIVNSVPQWMLFHREDFSSFKSIGWDNENTDLVTECAGIQMLGGYRKFSKGEVSKSINNIPSHVQLRVKANFHFIDSWIGETGFMRLNIGKDGSMVYVWTDRHNQDTESYSVNVCGSGAGEGKFSVPIDLIVDHSYDSLTLSFGSTIEHDDPSDESWGVSAIEIYIR